MARVWTAAFAGLAVVGFSLTAACVRDGEWFTPSGTALGTIDCISPAPLDGKSGEEICLARLIADTPEAEGRCRREGGTTGPVSIVDRRLACSYRRA